MTESFKDLLLVMWFFSPAGVAILAAFYAGKMPSLKKFSYPIDFYATFRGKRVFGSHKTVRGFIVGTAAAMAIVYIQAALYSEFSFVRESISLDYRQFNPTVLGFLLGFGALAGDAIKSFFKRQMSIAPGKSWFPFDQMDHIIGGIVFTMWYVPLTVKQYIILFLFWFLIHPFSTFVGYLLKLKKEPL